jgi:outer membrane lipoprotein-sorting protein
MRKAILVSGWVALLFSGLSQAAGNPSPESILKDSDRSRGSAADGLSWIAELETKEEGSTDQVTYHIKAKENDALVEVTSPARKKGEIILFNDRNLWFFKPGLRKPVSISPRQKLMGQASNGDIASTNYARDYTGTIVGPETVGTVKTWKMELKAKSKNVTYDRIRYWVGQSDRLGIKAEFLTVGGDVFKRADFEYKNTLPLDGKTVPFVSQMKITDAANPSNVTTLVYKSPASEHYESSLFNVNNLTR